MALPTQTPVVVYAFGGPRDDSLTLEAIKAGEAGGGWMYADPLPVYRMDDGGAPDGDPLGYLNPYTGAYIPIDAPQADYLGLIEYCEDRQRQGDAHPDATEYPGPPKRTPWYIPPR